MKEKTIQTKNARIKLLEDYILALKHKQYGASSEKLDAIQVNLKKKESTVLSLLMSSQKPNQMLSLPLRRHAKHAAYRFPKRCRALR